MSLGHLDLSTFRMVVCMSGAMMLGVRWATIMLNRRRRMVAARLAGWRTQALPNPTRRPRRPTLWGSPPGVL